MAVTKIWPVRSRLDHPIDYAVNPEKTDARLLPDSLDDVMHYAVNEEKTEKQFYVSGVNYNPAIARREFQIVKEQFGKTGGIIAYHAYQSFARAEREGAPTRLVIAKEAVDEGLSRCCNLREFRAFLISLGYVCQFDENRKYWTIRQHDWKRPIRLVRMGEDYSNEKIRERLRSNSPEVRKHARRETRPDPGSRRNVKVNRKKTRKLGGLRGLYWHYCYLLGYYPRQKTKFYKVPPALRDDLMKLNYISQEARLLQEYHIDTLEQLLLLEQSVSSRLKQLKKEQKSLMGEKLEKSRIEMKICKNQLACCHGIKNRYPVMKEKLQQKEREKQERKKEDKTR